MYREKKDILADIFEMLVRKYFYVPFLDNNSFRIHYKGVVYDVLAIRIDEDDIPIAECVSYSPYKLVHLEISDLSIRTITLIYKKLVNSFDEE